MSDFLFGICLGDCYCDSYLDVFGEGRFCVCEFT